MIIKVLIKLCIQVDNLTENFNKELKIFKKDISELRSITTKMKNTLEGVNNRSDGAEEYISNQVDWLAEIKQLKDQKEKRIKKNQDRIRNIWDSIKCTNN